MNWRTFPWVTISLLSLTYSNPGKRPQPWELLCDFWTQTPVCCSYGIKPKVNILESQCSPLSAGHDKSCHLRTPLNQSNCLKCTACSQRPDTRQLLEALPSENPLSAHVYQNLLPGSASLQGSQEERPQSLGKRWHFLRVLVEMCSLCWGSLQSGT